MTGLIIVRFVVFDGDLSHYRHWENRYAARTQHTVDLAHSSPVIVDVLEHMGRKHQVIPRVFERKIAEIHPVIDTLSVEICRLVVRVLLAKGSGQERLRSAMQDAVGRHPRSFREFAEGKELQAVTFLR